MVRSIPVPGLWRFGRAVWRRIADGQFGLIAAGVAFYAMFSVFPGLAALVAIWGLMADPIVIGRYLDVIDQVMPPDAAHLVRTQVLGLITAPRTALGGTTFLSLGVALFSARRGVAAIIEGLNVVNHLDRRGWLSRTLREVTLTMALVGALVGALATVVLVPVALSYLPLGSVLARFTRVLPWIVLFGVVLVCLGLLFRYGPNRPRRERAPDAPRRRFISAGVLFAALAWAGVSLGFSTYLQHFNSYNRVYGSIGAAIILMMWLYLSVWAILTGGAINAELDARLDARHPDGQVGENTDETNGN